MPGFPYPTTRPFVGGPDVNLPVEGNPTEDQWRRYLLESRRIIPQQGNILPEPSWYERLGNEITNLAAGQDLGRIKQSLPLGERIGAASIPLQLQPVAVMNPQLRGNKALQKERLDKLKFPGPTSPAFEQALEYYKKRYPRQMSHYDEMVALPETSPGGGNQVMLGGMRGAFLDPNNLENRTPIQLGFHPSVANTQYPMVAHNTLRHELGHGAQTLANKFGTPDKGGFPMHTSYDAANQIFGYKNQPYEQMARTAGLRGVIEKYLPEAKELPAKERQGFLAFVENNRSLTDLLELWPVYEIAGQDRPNREVYESLVPALRASLESWRRGTGPNKQRFIDRAAIERKGAVEDLRSVGDIIRQVMGLQP